MRILLLAAILAAPLSAQTTDPVERLATALSLDPDQADLAAEVFDARDPASVWTLASELVPTLDADQRAALFARPERAERPVARGQGRRGAGARGDRDGARGGRDRDPARAAVMRAARNAALGLDEAGAARLNAALDGLDRRAMMEAFRDGTVPDAVAAVLTPDQVETYRAQTALAGHLRRAGRAQRGQ